ncbi:uncharacterized protein LOC124290590 isoform X4 [Haliotis rubra]|uniref:uncharacterized protein LOC124290590 isoform X4 n=1 Tax=Haliotis rubra TaxID=36100 RepID=UPI001EE535FE|nr:uncharacterized protein LOC124290590 isoform X4 [Haliotis rubra]
MTLSYDGQRWMKTLWTLVVLVVVLVATASAGHKCKYERQGKWSECENGKQTVTKVKQEGSDQSCPQKKVKTRMCACKYQKGNWSECDPMTKKMTRTLTLVKGSDQCPPSKTRQRRCRKRKSSRKACKYNRGPWSQCDPVTNKMQRTMTLKRGDRDACDPIKKVTRQCRRRAALTAARIHTKCKYEFADWQQCDLRTNTMTRIMNLVQGDPEKCAPTKELKRKCRKPCKFRKGSWSACHPTTHLMTRMDTLIKGDKKFCSNKRQITKKCKKGKRKCQYDIGEWSDCNTTTNKRTRVKKLKKGDLKVCKPEIAMTKSCSRPNGKERCFFGKWGEYLPCMNGVMTKTRELIQGGTECERKAVKTKACS